MFRTFFSDNGILNYDHLTPAILTAYFSPVSLMFSGEPGTGKTTMVEILAHCEDKKFEAIDCPTLTQVEALLGIPNPQTFEKGSPDFEWAGGLAAKRPGVVLVDELTAAPQTVQTVLHEFVRVQRIGNHQLDCRVVATCNPPTLQTETNFMGTALATRFSIIHIPLLRDPVNMRQVVDNFRVKRSYSEESCTFIQQLADVPMDANATPQIQTLMHFVLGLDVITQYGVNYRQINNIMNLLVQAYTFETAGYHHYTNVDIGYLIASAIPCQLVKIPSLQKVSMETIAQNIAKSLPSFPFQEDTYEDARERFPSAVYNDQFQELEEESFEDGLVKLFDQDEDAHLNTIRLTQVTFKLLDTHPEKLRAINWSNNWKKDLLVLLQNLKSA